MAKSRRDILRQYATAAFETAVERWQKPLEHVAEILEEDPATLQKLEASGTLFEERKAILDSLIPPETGEEVRNFLYLLLQKHHMRHLPGIMEEFTRLAWPEAGIQARVVTAVPLNEHEQFELETKLRARYGENLRFNYEVDESVLGGIYVQVGDVVIDGTLAGKLRRMKEQIAGG